MKGVDYEIRSKIVPSSIVVVLAIHGGGIEPGTSELANQIGNEGNYTLYGFDGMKSSGNSDLHITSTRFDEPLCLNLVQNSFYKRSR